MQKQSHSPPSIQAQTSCIKTLFKKSMQTFFSFSLALILMMTAMTAEAKRFGDRKNMGRQSSSNSVQKYQQNQQAPNPQAPNQQNSQTNQGYNNAYQAPASKPSMFGGFAKVLGGVAAAVGLAWLASQLGIQGEIMGIMGIILLLLLGFAVFAWFKKRKQQTPTRLSTNPAYAGVPSSSSSASSAASNQYHSNNAGNQERFNNSAAYQTHSQQNASFGQQGTQAVFASDVNQASNNTNTHADNRPQYARDFEQYAHSFFEDVQKLHHKGANDALSKLLTSEMYQIFLQDAQTQGDPDNNSTGDQVPNTSSTYLVRNLSAKILDYYEESNQYFLGVLYQGSFYENDWQHQKNEESPINEIWQMIADKPATYDKPIWKLAGITQMPN